MILFLCQCYPLSFPGLGLVFLQLYLDIALGSLLNVFSVSQNKLSSSRKVIYDYPSKLPVHTFKSYFIRVEHKDLDFCAAFQRCCGNPVWGSYCFPVSHRNSFPRAFWGAFFCMVAVMHTQLRILWSAVSLKPFPVRVMSNCPFVQILVWFLSLLFSCTWLSSSYYIWNVVFFLYTW